MDTLTKQPYEQFTITVDFSSVLVNAETIADQSVIVVDASETDVTADMIVDGSLGNDGQKGVAVMIKGGLQENTPHKITVRCETSLSHKWEHDIALTVEDE